MSGPGQSNGVSLPQPKSDYPEFIEFISISTQSMTPTLPGMLRIIFIGFFQNLCFIIWKNIFVRKEKGKSKVSEFTLP